jgi:hypothetical protein
LCETAWKRGYEAAHVAYHGMARWRDWSLLDVIEAEDWVLVTNNVTEFRSRYLSRDLHAGVIFLLPSVAKDRQVALFAAALDEIARDLDLVNTAIDLLFQTTARESSISNEIPPIVVERYRFP